MNDEKALLALMENAEKEDTETLDEIEGRFYCWRRGFEFLGIDDDYIEYQRSDPFPIGSTVRRIDSIENFHVCRSLDAQEAIPTKWDWEIIGISRTQIGWRVLIECKSQDKLLDSTGKSEKLARLAVWFRVLEYEREQG